MTMTIEESSSSSLSTDSQKGRTEAERLQVEAAIRATCEIFTDEKAVRQKASRLCEEYGVTEFLKGIAAVKSKIESTGKPVSYGYLLGILKNARDEGGIVGPSVGKDDLPRVAQRSGPPIYRRPPEERAFEASLKASGGAKP